ncbi:chitooligosaccharide deacetylase [Alkalihalobacillus alcalophilus ATCC 27647 = CGMCC 1.3604]|uniref:Chitooligosaccharide deacetylase n=1 Tax=Alkalihalobacillus alcalophilus ATCC 27647 = CGMCC 1.3604 TaxID=1218173 RepID=A0A094WMG2_ALKAL|nr:polysaccharide deacetylase family protein [Alkalihalobacillus alcalophilus]KGA98939.1 chitooligosaccharide deacetylase [Alkalihalobacillus alcalophilus ATCC 27647 = CGMCC 1.3604]MED1561971.1 polysaccharide deacetylase family protein [Alkalihalobacillus alcalophilus]THG90338.1 chitooligosaccharide deacetylase [Alkalihalobacillus alcalophilus ATCC 27647 = CGMCC 1.3604]
MKERMFKWLLIIGLLFCYQMTDLMTVSANKDTAGDVSQQWWKKDKPDKDFPDLRGGPENPERQRQQPVDMNLLQQRYPDTFILQGPTDQNRIALTFDDGPDARFTEDVLDVLNQYNVPATFFLLGSRAVAYPEIVTRIQNEGHVIANHTYFHPNLVDESDIETLEREVSRTEDALNDIIGYRTSLFRPPYGFLYNELVEKLAEMQYLVIGWSVDSLDWQEDPPETIAANVLDNVQPGAIILMHDGADWDGDRTNTIESLHQIIPALQEQGYEFVTVPELLNVPFAK